MTNNRHGEGRAVWLSAITGEGLPMLKEAIANRLRQKTTHRTIHLQPAQGRQRAKLFELGAVLSEAVLEDGSWTMELRMAEKDLRRFLKRENLHIEQVTDQLEPAIEDATAVTAANE